MERGVVLCFCVFVWETRRGKMPPMQRQVALEVGKMTLYIGFPVFCMLVIANPDYPIMERLIAYVRKTF